MWRRRGGTELEVPGGPGDVNCINEGPISAGNAGSLGQVCLAQPFLPGHSARPHLQSSTTSKRASHPLILGQILAFLLSERSVQEPAATSSSPVIKGFLTFACAIARSITADNCLLMTAFHPVFWGSFVTARWVRFAACDKLLPHI